MWVVRFPGSVSGTDTSAESPQFRLIRPSQLTQSTLESPCRLRFVISISGAHTRRPLAPLSLSSPWAVPSYALPVALLQRWVRHSPMGESCSRPFSRAFLIHDAGLPKLSGLLHNHRSSPTGAERLRALIARTAINTLQRTLRSYLHVLLFKSVRWSDTNAFFVRGWTRSSRAWRTLFAVKHRKVAGAVKWDKPSYISLFDDEGVERKNPMIVILIEIKRQMYGNSVM